MKRIATRIFVAAALSAGVFGVAQAHTSLDIGLGIGMPVYAEPAPVYAPAPVYVAPRPVYYGYYGRDYDRDRYYRHWDHDRGWHRGWDHGRGWRD
jgi:PXPV repeat (3 copies)